MRSTMALTLCVATATVAGITGCYIVQEDKPANTAPPATTAAATAAPSTNEVLLRSAPKPPPLTDGG
jgi:hypothetical protein